MPLSAYIIIGIFLYDRHILHYRHILYHYMPLSAYFGSSFYCTLANSKVSGEMTYKAAFHQGSTPFAIKTKMIFIQRNTIFLEILSCDP